MQKIGFILFAAILISGCAITGKKISNSDKLLANELTEQMFENIQQMNISKNGFFIKKAEIKMRNNENTEKVIGTVKFEVPGNYLISIKNVTGLEGARIFITKDTILVNDRLNKKLYYGSSDYLKKKYGISTNILPVIFGDFIFNESTEYNIIKVAAGIFNISCSINGTKINYTIDSGEKKVVKVSAEGSSGEERIDVSYKKFRKMKKLIFPEVIIIQCFNRSIFFEIKIKKIEIPYYKQIEFIPGIRYEKVELL